MSGMFHGALHERVAGLDVADGYIAAAEAAVGHDGRPVLLRVGVERLIAASPDDHALVAALRTLWRRGGFRTRTVRTCLRSPSLVIRHFQLSHLAKSELPAALRLEAEEQLQLDPAEIAMDWTVDEAPSSEPADNEDAPRTWEGVLVAAPRRDVDRHLRLLRMAGLYPVAVDAGCTAMVRLESLVRGEEDGPVCWVHVTRHAADMILLGAGPSCYPRTFLARGDSWPAVATYFGECVDDNLSFYEVRLHCGKVRRVIFTGDIADRDEFIRRFRDATGLDAGYVEPLSGLDHGLALSARKLARCDGVLPPAVGLALAGGQT